MNKFFSRVFVAVFCLVVVSGCQKKVGSEFHGQMAPDFTVPLLEEEKGTVTLSQLYHEKVVLLNFWATWCPVCVEEIPAINQLAKEYPDLEILAVNIQESREEIKSFTKRMPMQFPVALDLEGKVAEQYGLIGLPVSIVISKGGRIIYYGFSLPSNMKQLINEGAKI